MLSSQRFLCWLSSLFPVKFSACYISWFFSADDPHVQYSAVSSFVFLRFFAVAVVSPHTFHLRPHHPVSFVKLCSVLFITVGAVYLGKHKLLQWVCNWETRLLNVSSLSFQYYTSPEELRHLQFLKHQIFQFLWGVFKLRRRAIDIKDTVPFLGMCWFV